MAFGQLIPTCEQVELRLDSLSLWRHCSLLCFVDADKCGTAAVLE